MVVPVPTRLRWWLPYTSNRYLYHAGSVPGFRRVGADIIHGLALRALLVYRFHQKNKMVTHLHRPINTSRLMMKKEYHSLARWLKPNETGLPTTVTNFMGGTGIVWIPDIPWTAFWRSGLSRKSQLFPSY